MEARTSLLCFGHHSDSSLKPRSCGFCSKFRYSFIRRSPLRFLPTGEQSTSWLTHWAFETLRRVRGRVGQLVPSCAEGQGRVGAGEEFRSPLALSPQFKEERGLARGFSALSRDSPNWNTSAPTPGSVHTALHHTRPCRTLLVSSQIF